MKKSNLALALAAAFAAAPALGQATVEQMLQILQQEIDDLKVQVRRAAPSTQQPAPYSQDYSSPFGRSLSLGSGGTNIHCYSQISCTKFTRSGDATADLDRFEFRVDHRFD